MNQKNRVGVGIIGLGYMGTHHLKVLSQLSKDGFPCQVVGLCDENERRLKKVSKKYDISLLTTSSSEIFENDNVSAVYITTPWTSHYDLIKRCVKAGKHFYCEKPIGADMEQVNESIELAEQSGLINQAGLLLRHQPSMWKLKHLIDNGNYGDVKFVSLIEDASFPNKGDLFQTSLNNRLIGRGILWEENIHDIDSLLHLFGHLSVDSAELIYSDKQLNAETSTALQLRTDSDARIQFNSLWHSVEGRASKRHLSIFFDRAVIVSDYFTSGDIWVQKSGEKPRHLIENRIREEFISHFELSEKSKNRNAYPWYATFADLNFITSVATGRSATPSLYESLEAHAMIDNIYKGSKLFTEA